MTHKKQYEEKHKELRGIMSILETKFSAQRCKETDENAYLAPKFKSMIEICPNNTCGRNYPCKCGTHAESDTHLEKIEELEDHILELKEQVVNFQRENTALRGCKSVSMLPRHPDTVPTLVRANSALENLTEDIRNGKSKLKSISSQVESTLRSRLAAYTKELAEKQNVIQELNIEVQQYKGHLERTYMLEVQLKDGLLRERKLRNEVLDLKGSIRVFCRIRPAVATESVCHVVNDWESIRIACDDVTKSQQFQYDRIFGASDGQESVYEEVSPLIRSGMDGYKVCVFAYGQTGSGKTHTMEGCDTSKGIIYKAIDEVFDVISAMEAEGWVFQCDVKIVEIYNESVRDLLCEEDRKIEIRHEDNKVVLTRCTEHTVRNRNELFVLLDAARRSRKVGVTMSNERSSRSHSVFILRVTMANSTLKEHREGMFNFIDLAGSERLQVSRAEGDRLKETQNINKSLAALGNVITALVKRDAHVPFRDSKLTFLLKDCLQGSARVLMFVNVAPETKHYGETLCSLRFAHKVSECKLGAVQRSFYKEIK